MRIVAIHQPSFFPWLGFFDKIIRSDIFVILDNVQYPKKGGFWSNRVKLLISGEEQWITMPVIRSYSGLRRINEMKIDNSKLWRKKIIRSIELNYGHAKYFKESFELIKNLVNFHTDDLTEYNLNAIIGLCKLFNIETSGSFVSGSKLNVSGEATGLLINIIKEVSGEAYLCGGGASKYQQDEMFRENNIKLIYQNFQHPAYEQTADTFHSGLSVIDALLNIGIEKTSELIHLKRNG